MRSRASFEQQALAHLDAAYNLAYWIVRNRADAEDVVQDAYVRALRAFSSCRGDVKPWLLTIVRNVAYRALSVRERGSNVVSLDEALSPRGGAALLVSETPSAEDVLIAAEGHALVLRALAGLQPAFREVLVLREIEELSYAEIAVVIGSPIGTVMSRLSRARVELKRRLAGLMAGDRADAV